MKKLAILTSLLALTACGGGSGGGAGTPGLTVRESNANVTGMNSFVVIGGENPTTNPNARVATTGIIQSDGGTRYDLENVTFKSIPTSGVIARLMFHTDDEGRITSIEFPDAKAIMASHAGSEVPEGKMKRQGDTNRFIWKDSEFSVPMDYISYAQEIGLKYSDFGILKLDVSELNMAASEYDTPFAGGYDVKNINNEKMKVLADSQDIIFKGIAKGQVSYYNKTTDQDIVLSGGLTDRDATLTFATDGSQTLAADFKNWAKIEAVKAADGTNQFIVRDSYVANDSPYYLESSPAGLPDSVMAEYTMAYQTGYYGDNDKPNEAVGLLQYQYQTGFNPSLHDYEHHVNVDLGFGGIKQ